MKTRLLFCKWHTFGFDKPQFEGQLVQLLVLSMPGFGRSVRNSKEAFVSDKTWQMKYIFKQILRKIDPSLRPEFMCNFTSLKKRQFCVWKSPPPITTFKISILLQLFTFTLPAMITASSVKHMLAAKRVGESIREAKGVRYVEYHNFFSCQVKQLLKKCNEQMW